MTSFRKAYVDLAASPKGWFLDVKAQLSDGSWHQWHSWCGEQPIGNDDPGSAGMLNCAPSVIIKSSDSLTALEKLLSPANWEKVSEGCRVGSSKTLAWVENYLGIKLTVPAAKKESDTLDIPV